MSVGCVPIYKKSGGFNCTAVAAAVDAVDRQLSQPKLLPGLPELVAPFVRQLALDLTACQVKLSGIAVATLQLQLVVLCSPMAHVDDVTAARGRGSDGPATLEQRFQVVLWGWLKAGLPGHADPVLAGACTEQCCAQHNGRAPGQGASYGGGRGLVKGPVTWRIVLAG